MFRFSVKQYFKSTKRECQSESVSSYPEIFKNPVWPYMAIHCDFQFSLSPEWEHLAGQRETMY